MKNKLTVVTINYNNKLGLAKTLGSISLLKSKHDYFEYVVVDGYSNDGSIELIRNSSIIDSYLVERDEGIADAFNKSVGLVHTEWVIFINSGDLLVSLPTESELNNFNSDCIVYRVEFGSKLLGYSFRKSQLLFRNYFPHQGMVIRTKMFDDSHVGLYDKNYKLGMDYHWNLRMVFTQNRQFSFINKTISRMELGGVSVSNPIKTFYLYHKARVQVGVLNKPTSFLYFIVASVKIKLGQFLRRLF